MSKRHVLVVATAFLLLVLSGCQQPTPITIFVTETPQPQIGAVGAVATSSPTAIPTVAQAVTQPAGNTQVFIGPVIGPEYTLPPTETPRPTETPQAQPTDEDGDDGNDDEGDEGDQDNDNGDDGDDGNDDAPTPDGPRPTALPTLDNDRMGVQLDPNLTAEDWNNAASARLNDHLDVGWIKVQLSWKQMQPNSADEFGDFFQLQEQHLKHADDEGFNILVSIAKAPAWARSNQAEDGPPDDPQALANFISFLLTKAPFIDAIEVWNEPNLQREWQTSIYGFGGGGYMQLFRPSYQAIQQFNSANGRGIVVVTAGLAPTGNNPGSRDDHDYLREMYGAGLAQFSGVSIGVHPYGWANPPDAVCCGTRGWDDNPHFFFIETLNSYRQIMNASGDSDSEMWVTEFGWATWDGFPGDPPEPWMAWTDKWQQANYTIRAFEIGQAIPNMGPMILWNLNFAALSGLVESRDERAAYSIVTPPDAEGRTERPLYWMLYDAVRGDVELEQYD